MEVGNCDGPSLFAVTLEFETRSRCLQKLEEVTVTLCKEKDVE